MIHEAGLDGFWIHRTLENANIESHVVDPASIATSRRRRRVKTDGVDGEALVRALLAHKRGEPRVYAMAKAPTAEQEDCRQISRERRSLTAERVKNVNRIKGLLFAQGITEYEPVRQCFPVQRRIGPVFARTWGGPTGTSHAASLRVTQSATRSSAGPEPHPALAVGRQWFRLVEASLDLTDARLVAAVSAVAEAVNTFANAELARLSLPSDAVAFAGFSQGATVALEAGLSRTRGCAGVLAYSGALAGGRVPSLAGRPPPPVFLRHGEQDNVLPPVLMQIAAKSLGAAGITTDAQLVPGLQHGIDASGVDAGAAFLAGLLVAVG